VPKHKLSGRSATVTQPIATSTPAGTWFVGSVLEGTVLGHRDGHGFVRMDDVDTELYLPPQQMRSVLHQDRVKVRVVAFDRRGRPEGAIVDILQRSPSPIIGRLVIENGVALVAPEDKRYGQDILLPPGAQGAAKAGQIVVAEITEPPSPYAQPVGRVVEVLGSLEDSGIEIEIAVRKFGVPSVFTPACEAQAEALPATVQPKDLQGRVDLTDVPLVTIDGEDARDFDDAVYCERAVVGKDKEGFRLIVAIADVSHYVRPETAIDLDAFERATSVYFPRRVIPMLPEKLSNGLCSLNPHVVRLAMVCDMSVTSTGKLHAYQFYPAAIRSHARLTYTEAWAMLSNNRSPEARARPEMLEPLNNLYDLYHALRKEREERGAIDFDTTETYIICDPRGRIERIVPRERNDAHKLIEECMLAANVCSADFLQRRKQTAVYRVHEGPTPERLATLQGFLKAHALSMGGGEDPQPKDFQKLAHDVQERPDAQQIQMMLLRSMQQAIYTPHNSGHFGLAYEAYTHFTSPIRRYPDLMVHRAIKAQLMAEKYKLPPIILPATTPPAKRPPAPRQGGRDDKKSSLPAAKKAPVKTTKSSGELLSWEAAATHCSACERRADEASRDVEAWLKCYFMRDKLGEEFSGNITGVTTFGLFIQLDTLYVEGMVHISELGSDYFRFDEARFELRGERTGVRYAIGDKVNVQVSRVDLDARKIEFRLLKSRFMVPPRSGGAGKTEPVDVRFAPIAPDDEEDTQALTEVFDARDAAHLRNKTNSGKGKAAKPGHVAAKAALTTAKAKDKQLDSRRESTAAPAKKLATPVKKSAVSKAAKSGKTNKSNAKRKS
jgi:ribonuclease R